MTLGVYAPPDARRAPDNGHRPDSAKRLEIRHQLPSAVIEYPRIHADLPEKRRCS